MEAVAKIANVYSHYFDEDLTIDVTLIQLRRDNLTRQTRCIEGSSRPAVRSETREAYELI
jgi:hypothetical protein